MKTLNIFETIFLMQQCELLIGIPYNQLPIDYQEKIIDLMLKRREIELDLSNLISQAGNACLGKNHFVILPKPNS